MSNGHVYIYPEDTLTGQFFMIYNLREFAIHHNDYIIDRTQTWVYIYLRGSTVIFVVSAVQWDDVEAHVQVHYHISF